MTTGRTGIHGHVLRGGTILWLALVVLWMTWTPMQQSESPNLPVLFPETSLFELLGNAVLLAPVGVVLALWSRRPIVAATAGAALVSGLVELGQVFLAGRIVSLTDVLLNTAGAALAGWVAVSLRPRLGERRLVTLTCGVVFALVLLFTLEGWYWFGSRVQIADWDPGYPILVEDEADGTKPFRGTVSEARICAGDPGEQVCAGAGAPEELRQRLVEAAERSQQVDVHARFVSATEDQWGPARIVTFSADQFRRNVTLAQEGTALVLRIRTPLGGPNGRRFELWIPRAVRAGETISVHARYGEGEARTEIVSPRGTRVETHTFDALSSGLVIRGTGAVTPLQVHSSRLFGGLILLLPVALYLYRWILHRRRPDPVRPARRPVGVGA